MLQQDFRTHENQDDAACDLGPGLVFQAEQVADFYACHGETEGDRADEGYGGQDLNQIGRASCRERVLLLV